MSSNGYLKQAQQTYDNQLPPDNTERDELISDLAEGLVENGVVCHPDDMVSYIYLDELDTWIDQPSYKSRLMLNKINQYKDLRFDLCKGMLDELLNEKGE